jgi:hypothetical protein
MIEATQYSRPSGVKTRLEITDIAPEDEKYLKDNNVVLSVEAVPPNLIGVYGKYSDDPNAIEAFVLVAQSRGCRVAMSRLVEEVKRMQGENE